MRYELKNKFVENTSTFIYDKKTYFGFWGKIVLWLLGKLKNPNESTNDSWFHCRVVVRV